MPAERIAIGTAQFGLPYGLANSTGQVPSASIPSILSSARAKGVDTIDTAIAYGDAEAKLGEAGVSGFRVVTKLPRLPEGLNDARAVGEWVTGQVSGSLSRLRVERVHAVLLHHPSDLAGTAGPALADALLTMRDAGLTEGLGVSAYAPADLEAVEGRLPWTVVQVPCSVVDQRFLRSGWIARLHASGVEVHARSIFLQGLLVMPPARRPVAFERWASLWRAWDAWQADTGQSALAGCLAFALSAPGISRIVVGIDGPHHLAEILSASEGPLVSPPATLSSEDRDLVEPTRWPRQQVHAR
jgi:aryl-alcohol dehydrogenase-like predicted oxidoreductase